MKKDLSLILNLFYEEIVPEAQNGCISIDDWQYHMQFFVSPFTTSDNSSLILHIHDENKKQTIFQQENIDDTSCWHKCHFGGHSGIC